MGALGALPTAEKYLFSGGTVFALDLMVSSVLISTSGRPTQLSAAVAFTVSTVFAFFTQMRYAFRSNVSTRGAVVRYNTLLAANMVFMAVVVDHLDSWWDTYMQGKIFSTGITVL